MDLYSSPATSPISSQEPMTQDYNSACLLRRKETEERLQLLVSTSNFIPSCEITGCPHHYPLLDNENHPKNLSPVASPTKALNNAPLPQMAPHKPSESETSAQNKARSRRNPPPSYYQPHNRQGESLDQPTDLLLILVDILNKFPGLELQLPRIVAVKNNRNQKYAIIEALLESESYV
ncbi:hypothetical protein NPIL_363161 [Nephila pilipes]|uniref:Uncharacterized protein n=1 Tax=Nephila pilipes TaxID=299642 RepID=A0A8X6NJZ9_NEPPI|nr:hypothetical protein NPIL_363161 [Nephila pilipes]